MLQIDRPIEFEAATAWPDDQDWCRYYVLPRVPAIRRDAEGRPIFLLVCYEFGDQARADDPTLPRGGGYVQFDVNLSLAPDEVASVTTALQARVDADHATRRSNPGNHSDPRVAGATPPRVIVSDPVWCGGSVKLLTTQAGALVDHRVAEQPAALLSGNNAVFNLDLSPEGVSFFRQLLLTPAGDGRVDLSGLQVVYDLRMWARLPPVSVVLRAHSEVAERVHQSLSQNNVDDVCTPGEVETMRDKGLDTAALVASGAVSFHVDKADPTVPDEVVNQLREHAYALFDDMLQERFLVPAEPSGSPLGFDGDPPGEGPDSGVVAWLYPEEGYRGESSELLGDSSALHIAGGVVRSVKVRSGHGVTLYRGEGYTGTTVVLDGSQGRLTLERVGSARVRRPREARYKLRERTATTTFDLQLTLSQSQVVEWRFAPQGSISTFFHGLSAGDIQRHVVALNLDDFKALQVDVRAVGDFSGVAAVEVEVEYAGLTDDGERQVKTRTCTFTKAGETQRIDWSRIGDTQSYRWRQRVTWSAGNTQSPWTEWQTTKGTDLNVTVTDPGRIALDVNGAAIDWEHVRSCLIELTYSGTDASHGARHVLQLTAAAPSGRWDKRFTTALSGRIDGTVTWTLKDGKVVTGAPLVADPAQNLLVIPPPQIDALNVALVPAGDWTEVAQVRVTLRYEDTDGTVFDKGYGFTSVEQFAEWSVPLRDPTRRGFRYQVLVAWRSDRAPEERPWVEADGDQSIAIFVAGPPRLDVSVNPALLDLEATPAVTITLRHPRGEHTFAFTKGGKLAAEQWKLPLQPGDTEAWTWSVSWFLVDGTEVTSGPHAGPGNQLLVPRYQVPKAEKLDVQVQGAFVDYVATPLVMVDLTFESATREERHTVQLDPSAKLHRWTLALSAGETRSYRYAITYFQPDGTPVSGESGASDSPLLVIKSYKPTP